MGKLIVCGLATLVAVFAARTYFPQVNGFTDVVKLLCVLGVFGVFYKMLGK